MISSFEERSVWIQLISLTLVLAAYMVVSGIMLSNGVMALPPYVAVFAIATVLLVITLIAGHFLSALMGRVEPRDERDRLISWRAESNASWLLATGAFAAIAALIFSIQAVWVAHLLLLSIFASEILKLVLQITYYRGRA